MKVKFGGGNVYNNTSDYLKRIWVLLVRSCVQIAFYIVRLLVAIVNLPNSPKSGLDNTCTNFEIFDSLKPCSWFVWVFGLYVLNLESGVHNVCWGGGGIISIFHWILIFGLIVKHNNFNDKNILILQI